MGTGERTLRMAEQNHRWGLESAPGDPPGAAYADVAQLVERWLPKPKVAGSRPVVRFIFSHRLAAFACISRQSSRSQRRAQATFCISDAARGRIPVAYRSPH